MSTSDSIVSSQTKQSSWRKSDTTWTLGLFGTAIGAGVLFFPIRAGFGGLIPILLMLVLAYPIAFYCHRALARLCLSGSNPSGNITETVEEHFGKTGGVVITFLYFFAICPLLWIYGVTITNTFMTFWENQLGFAPLNRGFVALFLLLLMAFVIWFGKDLMVKVMSYLVWPFIASLVLISSSFSTETSYENQTKKAITNKFIYEAMTEFLKHQLEIYFIENPDEAEKIAAQVLINKRSRENAEKTRLNLKKKLTGSIDVTNMIPKFVDCRSKDLSRRELYIVEGDSALGSVKMARDAEFQAVIPVRGKILNCLKADYNKIFKNEIITDIVKLLGCGVEVTTKANKDISSFHLEGLRWNKIVICTDADVDGFQIRTLILTMLYRLTPTLIDKGYVYIAESPLFEITTKKRTYFAYTEKEKTEILATLEGEKYTLQRSKGLGENEADMMALTTMNPETRRLIQVTAAGIEETAKMFDILLGDDLQGRKDFIAEYGSEYLELADIS